MGFYDDAANTRGTMLDRLSATSNPTALTATNGNVSAAVERVLSEFGAL
jgi:hypothetical protein